MKHIAWVVLILLTSLTSAQAASFDCAKAKSEIEKMICDDNELSKLDEQLNSTYKSALQNSNRSDVIRQAQKKWIKDRNLCPNAACVSLLYKNRISELTSTSNSTDGSPAKTANKTICENLARLADSGELWRYTLRGRAPTQEEEIHNRIQTSPYSRPSEPRIIYEIKEKTGIHKYASFLNPDWGSCSDYRIWSLESHIDAVTPEVEVGKDNADEGADLSDAGARDELVAIGGNIFVIGTYYYFDRRTLKSAEIVKDGHIDRLCRFSSDEQPKLVVRKATNQTLCGRISKGRLRPIPWDNDSGEILVKSPDGTQLVQTKHLVIDLNADGKSEMLGLLEGGSGGGCGSTLIFLNTDDSGLKGLLNAQDDRYGQGVWGHDLYQGYRDSTYDVRVFVVNGKPYIFGKSKLVSLWNNHLKTWCEFDSLTQHHVTTVYKSVSH